MVEGGVYTATSFISIVMRISSWQPLVSLMAPSYFIFLITRVVVEFVAGYYGLLLLISGYS